MRRPSQAYLRVQRNRTSHHVGLLNSKLVETHERGSENAQMFAPKPIHLNGSFGKDLKTHLNEQLLFNFFSLTQMQFLACRILNFEKFFWKIRLPSSNPESPGSFCESFGKKVFRWDLQTVVN
jgi:hypothetical protein